ncbi:uncharacterized protein LOC127846657 isoform X2 [Dreissena polymorpha]|uniref:uncharacterized protein LOC127846657 isoform X2 n=1 Tax=Dreissena polymorpha TaxID=45954 RepID=UPI002265681B|nr:uncharacterized protein LOC127846657 isoform X2 [Dreissena polymorpha]
MYILISNIFPVVPKEDITLESNIVTIPDDSIYSFAKDTECNSQLASDLRRAEDDECRIQQLEDDDPTYSSTNETLSKSQSASARPDIAACVPPSTLKVDGEYSYSVVNKCKKPDISKPLGTPPPQLASDDYTYSLVNKCRQTDEMTHQQQIGSSIDDVKKGDNDYDDILNYRETTMEGPKC